MVVAIYWPKARGDRQYFHNVIELGFRQPSFLEPGTDEVLEGSKIGHGYLSIVTQRYSGAA